MRTQEPTPVHALSNASFGVTRRRALALSALGVLASACGNDERAAPSNATQALPVAPPTLPPPRRSSLLSGNLSARSYASSPTTAQVDEFYLGDRRVGVYELRSAKAAGDRAGAGAMTLTYDPLLQPLRRPGKGAPDYVLESSPAGADRTILEFRFTIDDAKVTQAQLQKRGTDKTVYQRFPVVSIDLEVIEGKDTVIASDSIIGLKHAKHIVWRYECSTAAAERLRRLVNSGQAFMVAAVNYEAITEETATASSHLLSKVVSETKAVLEESQREAGGEITCISNDEILTRVAKRLSLDIRGDGPRAVELLMRNQALFADALNGLLKDAGVIEGAALQEKLKNQQFFQHLVQSLSQPLVDRETNSTSTLDVTKSSELTQKEDRSLDASSNTVSVQAGGGFLCFSASAGFSHSNSHQEEHRTFVQNQLEKTHGVQTSHGSEKNSLKITGLRARQLNTAQSTQELAARLSVALKTGEGIERMGPITISFRQTPYDEAPTEVQQPEESRELAQCAQEVLAFANRMRAGVASTVVGTDLRPFYQSDTPRLGNFSCAAPGVQLAVKGGAAATGIPFKGGVTVTLRIAEAKSGVEKTTGLAVVEYPMTYFLPGELNANFSPEKWSSLDFKNVPAPGKSFETGLEMNGLGDVAKAFELLCAARNSEEEQERIAALRAVLQARLADLPTVRAILEVAQTHNAALAALGAELLKTGVPLDKLRSNSWKSATAEESHQ